MGLGYEILSLYISINIRSNIYREMLTSAPGVLFKGFKEVVLKQGKSLGRVQP